MSALVVHNTHELHQLKKLGSCIGSVRSAVCTISCNQTAKYIPLKSKTLIISEKP